VALDPGQLDIERIRLYWRGRAGTGNPQPDVMALCDEVERERTEQAELRLQLLEAMDDHGRVQQALRESIEQLEKSTARIRQQDAVSAELRKRVDLLRKDKDSLQRQLQVQVLRRQETERQRAKVDGLCTDAHADAQRVREQLRTLKGDLAAARADAEQLKAERDRARDRVRWLDTMAAGGRPAGGYGGAGGSAVITYGANTSGGGDLLGTMARNSQLCDQLADANRKFSAALVERDEARQRLVKVTTDRDNLAERLSRAAVERDDARRLAESLQTQMDKAVDALAGRR
jgi:chromosome segregation ATPase